MQCEDFSLQFLVVSLHASIGIGKGKKALGVVCCRVLIFALNHLFKYVVLQQPNLLLACNAEGRRDLRCIDVRLDQTLTKGVECRDIRSRKEDALTFERSDLFECAAFLDNGINLGIECRLNALAHLRCSSLGKGEDEDTVQRQCPRTYLRDDALDQYARLSRPCRRCDEDVLPTRLNRFLLIGSKLHPLSHWISPPHTPSVQSPPLLPVHCL